MNFKGETIEKIELNKVYLMDALEGIKKIEDKSIDLIVTDPPYFQGLTCNGKKGEFNDLIICKPFFSEFAKQCKRVLKDTGKFYMFCDWRGYAFYYSVLCQELPIRNLIVWDKTSGMGNMYNYQHEFILYATMTPCNQGGKNIWQILGYTNQATRNKYGEKLHPAQKPLDVIRKIVLDGSKEGDTVLDTFAGSGTTMQVCIEEKRKFIGFELSEKYYEIIEKRIKEVRKQEERMQERTAREGDILGFQKR